MELVTSWALRAVASVGSLALVHWLSHRWTPARPNASSSDTVAAFVLLGGVCMLLPSLSGVHPEQGWLQASLLGAWGLLQLGIRFQSNPEQDPAWLVAWGLTIAAPVTVYSTLDLHAVALAQDRTVADLIPAWGVFFLPFGFLISSTALAGWMAQGASVAPNRTQGLANGCLLILTASLYLGASSLPWIERAELVHALGGRATLATGLQWLGLTAKVGLLWLVVWKVRGATWWSQLGARPTAVTVLAAGHLALTWVWFAWKGGN